MPARPEKMVVQQGKITKCFDRVHPISGESWHFHAETIRFFGPVKMERSVQDVLITEDLKQKG